jgi:hypothetical protein
MLELTTQFLCIALVDSSSFCNMVEGAEVGTVELAI